MSDIEHYETHILHIVCYMGKVADRGLRKITARCSVHGRPSVVLQVVSRYQ